MSNDIVKIEKHLTKQSTLEKFMQFQGPGAAAYIRNVLIAVETDPRLVTCSPESIERAALRAASLQLSVDPAAKQAYLVKYSVNTGTRTKPHYEDVAVFQPHYLGLYTLAMRSNRYKFIEVIPLDDGYEVRHNISGEGSDAAVVVDLRTEEKAVFIRRCKPENAATWFGWFVTKDGQTKKVWRTVAEIHEHAIKNSPSYKYESSIWKNPKHRPVMEMKTVLRELLNWADLSGTPAGDVMSNEMSENFIDAYAEDIPPTEPAVSDQKETPNVPGPKATKKERIEQLTGGKNVSSRLANMKKKAETDAPTAFWEATKAAGLDAITALAIVKESGDDFAKAFAFMVKKYGEQI